MNTACPTCGAVYAVTPRDVGRKLKCKKCMTALAVTDAGLVVDGSAIAPAIPASATGDNFETGDEVVSTKSKKGPRAKYSGPGAGDFLAKLGGIPTILFGLGTFLVIWFTFMEPIGHAAITRAQAAVDKLKIERDSKIKKLLPKGKKEHELNEEERKKYQEDAKKINEDFEKQMETAVEDAASTRVNNIRSVWFDKYGQMFGFILLSFGCIGYLRTEQPLVMRIVAATVLSLMLLLIFSLATGGCSGPRPMPGAGAKGGIE